MVSALGAVSYRPVGELDQVHRVIQELDVRMRQSMGPNCRLTLDATQAQASAEARSVGAHSHTCLFEWIEVPDGMQQDPYSQTPYLFGSLRGAGLPAELACEHLLAQRHPRDPGHRKL